MQNGAETLIGLGAPGWDRTSNPCLRRAVLYPLSYGRISAQNAPKEKPRRIAHLGASVHRRPVNGPVRGGLLQRFVGFLTQVEKRRLGPILFR